MLRNLGVLGLLVGLFLGRTAPAHADRLDARLNDEMPRIVKHLKDKGYKNVGVLRFRAQRGGGKLSFHAGPINGTMIERMENLLVIHAGTDKGPLFGITHNAGVAAQDAKVGAWATSESERKKLFDVSYPLAWGKEKVKVDAFLTGKVVCADDLQKTTVTIESFSKGTPTLVKVAEFTLDTDSGLVRDFGYSFALSRSQRAAVTKARDGQKKQQMVDEAANKQPRPRPEEKGQQGPSPENTAGLKFELRVEGAPASFASGADADARYEVACPPRGKSVAMYVKNTTDKTLAFVLKVAGKSTVEQQTDDSIGIRKWVIQPGKTFKIDGYYQGEKLNEVIPFAVVDGESARKMIDELGEKVQFIQLDVFEQGAVSDPKGVTPRRADPAEIRSARRNFRDLRGKLVKGARLVKKRDAEGREFLGPADEPGRPTEPTEVVEFPYPTLVGSLTIRVTPNPGQPVVQQKPQGKEPQPKSQGEKPPQPKINPDE